MVYENIKQFLKILVVVFIILLIFWLLTLWLCRGITPGLNMKVCYETILIKGIN